MVVDREPLDAHQVRDLLDREALAEVGQHLAFARGQALVIERRTAAHRHRAAALEARVQRHRAGIGAGALAEVREQ
ncbi:MAG: hypothetical protein ABUL50_00910, partial [Rhizobacter sp.]